MSRAEWPRVVPMGVAPGFMDLDRSSLSASGSLREMIVEPFRRARAIPNSNEFWCLPEIDVNNSDIEEDGKLLQLMIAGEERGFVSLYQKYQSRVYRFSLQISGTQHLAEEVTQETFLAVIRATHKYEVARGPLLLYLFGIAGNLAWKSMRRDRLFVTAADQGELPDLRTRRSYGLVEAGTGGAGSAGGGLSSAKISRSVVFLKPTAPHDIATSPFC
jgi:sigma-70-like protein